MTRFAPFAALRYHRPNASTADISDVVAPPYDVLSDAQRTALEHRDPANSVRLDFPHGATDPNAYAGARTLLDRWIADGTLLIDVTPTLTVYRMTPRGSSRSTTGVLGALRLEQPGVGDVLPHEETTAKDKADRLNLIRSTEVNTSPIWVLATVPGLGEACASAIDGRPADAQATDDDGVLHQVWVIADDKHLTKLVATVEGGPVVVADGHHRFETALTYEKERPEASAILTYVVELAESELEVRPIHRIITAPTGSDSTEVVATLDRSFERRSVAAAAGLGPTLLTASGEEVLVPRDGAFDASIQLDSERIRIALSGAAVDYRFHHDAETVAGSVSDATIGVLLRPATVAQIRAVADARTRMPPKTTFFWPKPRTGLLFRPVVASTSSTRP